MPAPADALVVLTTCPNRQAAGQLAQRLVETRLAACVNLIGGVQSIYRWQGQIEQDEEVLLLIKSTAGAFAAIGQAIREASDYDVPEVLALPVSDGSRDYLDWLIQSVDGEEV